MSNNFTVCHIDLVKKCYKLLLATVTRCSFLFFSAVPEDSKDFAGLLADVSSYTRSESKHFLEPLVIKG